MDAPSILVCVGDHAWTLEALHLAAALALDTSMLVQLVQLVQVDHPMQLGTDYPFWHYSDRDQLRLRDYRHALQDYGVPYDCTVFQYVTLTGAVVDLVDALSARVAFVSLPPSRLPGWRAAQRWLLRRSLQRRGCDLFTLDTPLDTLVWRPRAAGPTPRAPVAVPAGRH